MSAVIETKQAKAKKVGQVIAKLSTIGEKIDALQVLREKKRSLQDEIKKIEGEFEGICDELIIELEAQNVDGSRGKLASCSISKSVVANVIDWPAFHAYIKKTGQFHLLQKRVSEPAFRELIELKGEAAVRKVGVEPFVKKTLNLKSL